MGFYEAKQFAEGISTNGTNEMKALSLSQITELISILEEKKRLLREDMPVDIYKSQKNEQVEITYITRRKVNVNKCFSFLLKKGKMKTFISSCSVSVTSLLKNGVDMKDVENMREYSGCHKAVKIRHY